MGFVSRGIVTEEEESPEICKEARLRRIEMRRRRSSDSPGNRNRDKLKIDDIDVSTDRKRKRSAEMNEPLSSSSASSSSGGGGELEPISTTIPSTSGQNKATDLVVPVYGSVAVSGRSREMEDAISVRPDFCRPVISYRKPLHFFAVYDGHGGSHVATLCKEKMHVFLKEELMKETDESAGTASTSSAEEEIQDSWKLALEKSFEIMDEIALSTCACGCVGSPCLNCDDSAGLSSEIVGTTAVIALLTTDKIIVANCGDSRAVLSRGGRAIPLSFDHKPDRPDELARIEAAGGRVIYLNGARVQGILAMSRALGDKYLKPVVISKPDISFTNRTSEDECLILASDGLWDVLSNEMACDVARRCLFEGMSSTNAEVADTKPHPDKTQTTEESLNEQSLSRCSIAAALLTRLALGRRSADNISVIVIDLKRS